MFLIQTSVEKTVCFTEAALEKSSEVIKVGVYIFHFAPPPFEGWGKNMMILLRKNANVRDKRWKKGGKEGIFTVLGGKKYHFRKKKGGGGKISIIWLSYTPAYFNNQNFNVFIVGDSVFKSVFTDFRLLIRICQNNKTLRSVCRSRNYIVKCNENCGISQLSIFRSTWNVCCSCPPSCSIRKSGTFRQLFR